ncbi:meiotically up-regulated 80 protein [Escherichia coli]
MAIVHRLQQIMVNENLTPDELVGCAEIVWDNYGRFNYIGQSELRHHHADDRERRQS